jgi:threonine dehydratase
MDQLAARDVIRAQMVVRRFLTPPPLYSYPALNQVGNAEVYVKHENHSPVGSFKARRALAGPSRPARVRRVVACSSGNHGMGVAYASRLLQRMAIIVVPEWPIRRERDPGVGRNGADVWAEHGRDAAPDEGTRDGAGGLLADDGGDPWIAASAGTVGLEMLDEVPDLDVLLIPPGDGALAGGCGVVAKDMSPAVQIVGVQSEACPAQVESWR